MLKLFTRLRRYIHGFSKGFTLIELLVALIVAAIVLSLALRLIVDQRQLFVQDQVRTQINQNLRAAIDLVGTDIKQTGERLVENTLFPVVKIIDNGSGDKLVLQRNLVDQSLPVCQNIGSTTPPTTISTLSQKTIDVSIDTGGSPIASCPFSNGNAAAADVWPDTLEQLRNARCNKDGKSGCQRLTNLTNDPRDPDQRCAEDGGRDRECLWVYIYNPTANAYNATYNSIANKGEFFLYTFEDSYPDPRISTQTRYRIYRGLSNTTPENNVWINTYAYDQKQNPYTNNPVINALEEREYSLSTDQVLQLVVNPNRQAPRPSPPIRLVNQVGNFQVIALPQCNSDPNIACDFNNKSSPPYSDNWQALTSIQVDLKAINLSQIYTPRNAEYLKVSSKFFPRNAASRK